MIVALLVMFTVMWSVSSAANYYFTTQNSDCTYAATEPCTAYAQYEQQVTIWRFVAIQLAIVLAALLIRKR